MKVEDRGKVQRTINSDFEEYLFQRKGESYREYRRAWNRTGDELEKHPHPLQLNIELTSFCNLWCKMCYYNFIENKTRESMPLELVEQIVKEAKELQVESIWLGAYSEALLHPHIVQVLQKFAEVESEDYWLLTNGTLLNREIAGMLVDIPLTWLSVSLDAAIPETYKKIRGGRLELVEKNISEFLEIREKRNSRLPFLRVSFVDMKENHDELELFKEKWKGKADIVDVQTLVDFSSKGLKSEINENFVCKDLYRLLSIKYDGELLPCCNSCYHNAGQRFYVQDCSIQHFWTSDFHETLLKSVQSKQYLPCCAECIRRWAE